MNGLKHSPPHNTEHTDGDRDVGTHKRLVVGISAWINNILLFNVSTTEQRVVLGT